MAASPYLSTALSAEYIELIRTDGKLQRVMILSIMNKKKITITTCIQLR